MRRDVQSTQVLSRARKQAVVPGGAPCPADPHGRGSDSHGVARVNSQGRKPLVKETFILGLSPGRATVVLAIAHLRTPFQGLPSSCGQHQGLRALAIDAAAHPGLLAPGSPRTAAHSGLLGETGP